VDWFTDPFKQPMQHAKTKGAVGFPKGLGKGVAGFVSKTSSAVVGLVAYHGDGICKSMRYAVHGVTRRGIRARKLVEGEWIANELETNVMLGSRPWWGGW
jgi:hypothetical protein